MNFIQKTKRTIIYRYISWFIYFISFLGLLLTSIFLVFGEKNNALLSNPNNLYYLLCLFTILFGGNLILQYFIYRKNDQAFLELNQSLKEVEQEIGITASSGKSHEIDMMTVSAALNYSLQNLNEKNTKLKSEIEKNERLSENISEFYRQMKTLREAELIFDFFEYEIKSSLLIFISGMITALADENELTEITAKDLFDNYKFSISLKDFNRYVSKCLNDNTDMNFECSVAGKGGKEHWLKFWGRPSKDKTRITGAITDITREVRGRNIEKERAIHDNITGFYNRNALSEVAGKAISECGEGESVVFVYIGLTGYQEFQERFGKVAGNSYIRVCAEVFKKFLTNNMIPLRWWGSDFLLLVKGVKSLRLFRKQAIDKISKVEKYIGEVDGIAVTFSMAVGYAASGIHGKTPAELLEYASFAEHEALREVAISPNEFNYERFEEAHKASLRRTFIKDIIDRNQLSVVFQPIVSLRTGELFGFEALSRPMNPIYSSIIELIDDAEASGHYVILEKRMVYNALDAYMERDIKFKDHFLFINTAPYATLDERDYNDIRDRYFGHMKVVFEVIERNRMEPEEINLRKSIVTKAGAKFALDDFGSGYSNHLALLALEPDIIKIDKELVQGIDIDLRKQHMLEDIISYARYRGTRVLAEGVETQGELETLCRMGIDYVQGYFTGRPSSVLAEPSEEAKRIIKSISHNNQIYLKQVYIMIEKSFSMVNEHLGCGLSIVMYLVLQLCKRLGYDRVKLSNMIITTMLHNIGVLYPGSKYRDPEEFDEISEHSIFAYLVYKEFSPCPEYARTILYHHKKYGVTGVVNNITIPDEAYLLSLAISIADTILNSKDSEINKKVISRLEMGNFKPEYKEVFEELCRENLLSRITTGDYRKELLSYIETINLSKAEIESVIRTFIYAISFRTSYHYSHPRVMETTVNVLGRMTKQNWHLLEKVRIAALLYNLGMLTMDKDEFEKEHTPEELHNILTKAVKKVNVILEEADLIDIINVFNAAAGEETFSGKHILMGKDIINGAKMLNIADIFSSIMEVKCSEYAIACLDAIEELKNISKNHELYLPMVELMEEYVEDIEARVKSSQADIDKHYNNIMSVYKKLKGILLDNSAQANQEPGFKKPVRGE